MSNQIPDQSDARETRRAHWDRYLPVNRILSDVVETLAGDIVDASLLDKTELLAEASNTYQFPYGRMSVLPPALFGTITMSDIVPERHLSVPTDKSEIDTMVDSYERWTNEVARSGRYSYVSIPTRDVLINALEQVAGRPYPREEWWQSARTTREVLRQEPIFTMDVHRVAQINAGVYYLEELPKELQPFYRQLDSYVIAPSRLIPEDGRTISVRELPQMPVGEYGKETAERLAQTVTFLGDFIRTSPIIDASIDKITASEGTNELLRKHTMRTRESFEDDNPAHLKNGLSDALIGGILSMAQVIAFLTAEKIEGYDTFDALVADILDSDVLEEFARLAPVGYIGPTTLGGIYIPHALDTTGPKLTLSKQMKEYLGAMHRGYLLDQAYAWKDYDDDPKNHVMPRTLGLTCPASEPHGAIASLRPVMKSLLVH